MIFNTWTFALFFATVLVVYWALVPKRAKPAFLIIAGCIFYVFSVPAYLALVAALGVVTFLAGQRIIHDADTAHRSWWMIAGVSLIALTLGAFKYLGFLAQTVDAVAHYGIVPVPHVVVPLAISFFTFEFIHVLVDAYLGKIGALEPMPFAAFTMFFPTLVAGPIKRYESFVPQLHRIGTPSRQEFALNIYRIVLGLAKKTIIADSMSVLTDPLTSPLAAQNGRLDYIVAIVAYTIKIYFDFSGYSDIAIGAAGLLGLSIPENFDMPYRSKNISTFWRRWHMSLSSWIRDYIFIPLGGSRRPPLITALNLFIAMAIAGLWHGASWTFVAWGLWHGAGLVVHRAWENRIVRRFAALRSGSAPIQAISWALTLAFVMLGWTLFAAPTFDSAAQTVARAVTGAIPPPSR